MQNSLIARAELRFWRALNPLLQGGLPLKRQAQWTVHEVRGWILRLNELIEVRYRNVYLLVCVLCGAAALGCGYALGFLTGR